MGSIATIFGTNLAASTEAAQGLPLPLNLAGTSVTIGGVSAPLFYVSPTQINLEVPVIETTAGVIVSTPAGSSPPYDPGASQPSTWATGGIFTTDSSGCGQGAVLNVAPDGSLSVNSPSNSASPGSWVSIFGTGMISLNQAVVEGWFNVPAPYNPPVQENSGYVNSAAFDLSSLDSISSWSNVGWAGLAPGYVGLDQINVHIPAGVREGCAVPLVVAYDNGDRGNSQPVTIAIRQGGGQCVDPPPAGFGQIVWEKDLSTDQTGTVSEADTILASFQASPGQQAPAVPTYTDLRLGVSETTFGPACAVPGYRSLGAGTVTAQGPGLPPTSIPLLAYQQGQASGLSAYQATLPAGAVAAGSYAISATGGPDVGAFQSALKLGEDIQIQTALAGASISGCSGDFTVTWAGGDPDSWVTVQIVQQAPASYGGFQFSNFGTQTRTSHHTATFSIGIAPSGCSAPYPVTVVVEVDPDPSEIVSFSAPGLSLGGQASWRYVHSFAATLYLN